MKVPLGLAVALLAWTLPLAAQTEEPLRSDVERARLEQQRAVHEANYLQSEQACYQRFAVSDCLQRVRATRRTALNELRRQELILNDLERQSKAVSELQRIQDNVAAQQSEQAHRQATPKAP